MVCRIPGLHLISELFPRTEVAALQKNAINLHQATKNSSKDVPPQKCKTFISQYHNQTDNQFCRLIRIEEAGRRIVAKHFESYGDKGHELTYFIGNENLPQFLKEGVLPRICAIPQVKELGKPRHWNFTLNTYAHKDTVTLAGFDFHKDIPSNGEVTAIYSLGISSEFQIRHPGDHTQIATLALHENSFLFLSKEARWDYEHRVIPSKINSTSIFPDQEIKRISLVFGFNFK